MRQPINQVYSAVGIGACALLSAVLIIQSCKKDMKIQSSVETKTSDQNKLKTNATSTPYVCISNADNRSLEMYDYTDASWNSTTRIWEWQPTTAEGFTTTGLTYWDTPADQRVHNTTGFPGKATQAFCVVSHRWMGVVSWLKDGTTGYARGQKLWGSYFASSDPGLHACELLPDGNLVVAAATDDWIRVYNTSTTASTNYAQANLNGAHALLWDPTLNILWAGGQITIGGVGKMGIFAYTVGGTRTAPTLTEIVSRRSVLDTSKAYNDGGLRYPHDIQPDYDDDNKLIYSDHSGVYIYDKTAKTFTRAPGGTTGAGRFFNVQIKAAGKQADSGYYVMSEAMGGTSCPYSTSKVDFYDGLTGALSFTRTVSNCYIYRARIWARPYN